MAQRSVYQRIPIRLFPTRHALGAVSEARVERLADLNLMGKVAELDLLIVQRSVLRTPTAIFRGVKRPLRVPDDPEWYGQENVIVSIARPAIGADLSTGRPRPCAAPANSVFIALVRKVADQGQRDQIKRMLKSDLDQVFLLYWWEWVSSDPYDPDLPENHQTRFEEKWAWP